MLATQHVSSRLRLINLLIPPTSDPLLTPYKKQINPKINPMKRNLSILSNLKSYPTIKQEKISLTERDFVKINRSYQSLKKFKKNSIFNCEDTKDQEQNQKDPQYMRLIQMRKSMLRKKRQQQKGIAHSMTAIALKDGESSFLGMTQPLIREKPFCTQQKMTKKPHSNRYIDIQDDYDLPSTKNNQQKMIMNVTKHIFLHGKRK